MSATSPKFEKAHISDLSNVLDLLTQVNLPTDGVKDHFEHYILLKEDQRILGSVGVEIYSDAGLLRSLAVSPALQRKGLCIQLTQKALTYAQENNCKEIYILTTTAPDFFLKKFHFTEITRDMVNPIVKESAEFKGACPDTAVVMRLLL